MNRGGAFLGTYLQFPSQEGLRLNWNSIRLIGPVNSDTETDSKLQLVGNRGGRGDWNRQQGGTGRDRLQSFVLGLWRGPGEGNPSGTEVSVVPLRALGFLPHMLPEPPANRLAGPREGVVNRLLGDLKALGDLFLHQRFAIIEAHHLLLARGEAVGVFEQRTDHLYPHVEAWEVLGVDTTPFHTRQYCRDRVADLRAPIKEGADAAHRSWLGAVCDLLAWSLCSCVRLHLGLHSRSLSHGETIQEPQ